MSGNERQAIRDFITTRIARKSEHRQISDGDDVIALGVIDSLGIMHLIAYLEKTFGIRIKDDQILPENFASVDAIAGFVQRTRA